MLDMYNFNSVKIIIQDEDLSLEMRAMFLRLLLNLHMDQKLEPIQIPSSTGVWDELPHFAKEQFSDKRKITFPIKQSPIQVPNTLVSLKKFVENYLHGTGGS
jgi:hypothetical protein